ncbi:MAG: phytanoyl-CoA dioxygenase family protein [Chloroflexota bacterium]
MAKLNQSQIDFFNENGYLIIEDVLSDDDIAAVREEYTTILDREAPRLVDEGLLSQTYAHLPFEERYTHMLCELDDIYALYQYLDISLPLVSQMPSDMSLNAGPAVFNHVLTNHKVLDIAESVLGLELYSNPVQHARIKPPKTALPDIELDSNMAKTFWHQDEAVLTDDAVGIEMLTVWVAMTDATEENGCMVCVPGSHRQDVTMHCPATGTSASEIFIPGAMIDPDKVMPLPVKKGGVVILNQLTEHSSLENHSDQIRWSFDLRYNVIGQKTGRDVFPGFIARSEAQPENVLTDASVWADLWYETRDHLAAGGKIAFNERWERFGRHALCA